MFDFFLLLFFPDVKPCRLHVHHIGREPCHIPLLTISLTIYHDRGDVSTADKKAYIAAMLCLMEKPSKLDRTRFPGAQSRYDDFVVVHMNQTMSIHGTVGRPRVHNDKH